MEIKRERPSAKERCRKLAAEALRNFAVWAQKNAVSAFPVSTGCCFGFDLLRQAGAELVFNPHHADVLVIGGALSLKAAEAVRRIYEQMPGPKYVVAWGSCAAEDGLFSGSYAVARPSDIVPVDVYIPGCPPDAAAVAEGMAALRRVIEKKMTEGEKA